MGAWTRAQAQENGVRLLSDVSVGPGRETGGYSVSAGRGDERGQTTTFTSGLIDRSATVSPLCFFRGHELSLPAAFASLPSSATSCSRER